MESEGGDWRGAAIRTDGYHSTQEEARDDSTESICQRSIALMSLVLNFWFPGLREHTL